MTSTDIVSAFRFEMGDSVTPYLWTDQEVYPFLNDAQRQYCRKTDGIADSRTTSVCQLAVVPNTDYYATDPSILQIRKISRADTGLRVDMLTMEQADERGIYFLPTNLGVVRYVVQGLDMHSVRIYPMPNETITLNMMVWRLPLVQITDAGDQTLEIDSQHFEAMLMWMKKRAYGKQDTETFDRKKAADFEAEFVAYCAKAKDEQARARRVQGNIAYGGIQQQRGSAWNSNNRYPNHWF